MTDAELKAIMEKDRHQDGKIWFALRSGKTYCRPSCGKKPPTEKRILVFHSPQEAELAGFRPCRFCRPSQSSWKNAAADLSEKAKTYMQVHIEEKFSLSAMAEALQVDKSYLLRTFHAQTGSTPLQYFQKQQCLKACDLLSDPEKSMAEVAALAGFSTQALFSRVFHNVMGITPSAWREKAFLEMLNL